MQSDTFQTTYNARHIEPKEVAKSFIWSKSFGRLIQNNHSVILGARGCGKTTLMKMLTLPALHEWKSSKSENLKNNIPFYAIYISTDIYWDVKNQTYSSQLESYGKFAQILSHFSVNNNIFSSLCDTFLNILEYELNDQPEEKEIELCKLLIKAWKLESTIPKLIYIKESLNNRVDEVNQLVQHIIFNCSAGDDLPYHDYFDLNFESSLDHIIPGFERIYNLDNNKKKWALCFDELEFAPLWLQKKLFTSLRSRNQRLLYKLSSSPILPIELENTLKNEYGATSGNDVQLIKMWASDDNETFTRQIIQSLLNEGEDLKDKFGVNSVLNKSTDSYVVGSDFYKQMGFLIKKDFAFQSFLEVKKIDINKPIKNAKEKDILYRKIKPIVYFRNTFINKNEKWKLKPSYRSRKVSELYSGIEVLTKICDGNPRWIKGIISQLQLNDDTANKALQYKELLSASKKFRNVIANIPVGESKFTIIDIIDFIGNYFKEQVLGKHFNMDPYGTFVVNEKKSEVNDSVIHLIERGISQGAFILLDSDDDSFDFNIRGKKFKLSYLFSIIYHLPLRSYPDVKLSECLSKSDGIQIVQASLDFKS